ncbi:hypothetical protein V6N11_019631 [Hibiscus sabdariffa]|uniref:Uncharacterized protein n=1 Tax=Hibiscus sabdariffa TaxID=183260 RepID=A0ABR2NLA9_9ROSI
MTTMGFVRNGQLPSPSPSPSPSPFIILSGDLCKPPGIQLLLPQAKRYLHLHLLSFFPHSRQQVTSCKDDDEKRRMPVGPLAVLLLSTPALCCCLSYNASFRSDLSDNQLNGSIPESFSDLPSLQILSLQNNFLTGPVPTNLWQNLHFNTSAILMLDLRNNSFSSIEGNLNPPVNVILSDMVEVVIEKLSFTANLK